MADAGAVPAVPIDHSVLHYGDAIALQVDAGYLSCPSFYYEPIPDDGDAVRYVTSSSSVTYRGKSCQADAHYRAFRSLMLPVTCGLRM